MKVIKNELIIDNMFDWQECLDYAVEHKYDVITNEVHSSNFPEMALDFQKAGYLISFGETINLTGSLKLNRIYAKFTRRETVLSELSAALPDYAVRNEEDNSEI